ncbi:MAG: hypothetical protein [Hatfieldvirus porci]|uniref:Uncharacterized protein n=1 Tax=phage Lak_Megaphage_RVC_JS4_GC31 TaxID=3109228 RepID=A0ABZ0Z3X1_9CAUD|nr:MAG: hypothetical protein [phage Lak_Megaphage_RVC_JS4_GC31]
MKSFVQQIINEARIQRTIDSKIWASMSSASSKNRANGAVDVKPMRRDDANVLLQKYVAGLLTIKAECPATVTDIEKIGSYKLIGQAAIDAGVSLSQIQKLYVENGGTFNGDIKDNTEIASNTEYPAYDEIDNSDDTETEETSPSTTFDDSIAARINANEPDDNPDDESDQTEEINKQDTKDYPSYDEVDIENKETFADKYADKISIASYFKTVKRQLQRAKEGDNLCWGDKGLTLENNGNIIAKCVGTTYMFIDKNPRFLLKVSDQEVALGTAGNNKVYDDYYYKQGTTGLDNRISVKPGSNYYFQEEIKGKFYTNILADNGNEAAEETKIISDINIKAGVDSELSLEIAKNINERSYLPTLPELVKCIKHLAPGKYWTSSVANNGKANIILQVKPDRIIKTDNPQDTAKVATFITF